MLSLIQVQCPHCGARGQLMIPPVGTIIIGPCPQCNELVVVFCGQVLPLDKDTMENGSTKERKEHLLEVITEFLRDKLGDLLINVTNSIPESMDNKELEDGSHPIQEIKDSPPDFPIKRPTKDRGPISQSEIERFTDVDLKLIDNKAYFESVFDEEEVQILPFDDEDDDFGPIEYPDDHPEDWMDT